MSRRRIILSSSLALAAALVLAVAGWWQYVAYVPPYRAPASQPEPQPNGWWTAFEAVSRPEFNAYMGRESSLPGWPTEGSRAMLRGVLDPLHPAVTQLRHSLGQTWKAPSGEFAAPTRGVLRHWRSAARALAAEGRLAIVEGNPDRALDRSLDGMELGVRISEGGDVIDRLVAVACFEIAFRDVEPLVDRVSAPEAERALARARRIHTEWPSLANALEFERVEDQIDTRSELRKLGSLRGAWEFLRSADDANDRWARLRVLITPRRQSLAALDGYDQRVAQEAMKPERQRASVPVPNDPWIRLNSLGGMDEMLGETTGRVLTKLALLETALAARAQLAQRGRYPADSRGLEPMPRDQWDQPIVYRLKNGKPLIYSLGPDGKDDGGKAMDPRHAYAAGAKGDLVFGKLTRRGWQRVSSGRGHGR